MVLIFGCDEMENIVNSPKTCWPKWKALRNYVVAELETGKYEVGDPLPSEDYLSSVVGIARNTVRAGITVLENEGFVKKINNKGTFVTQLPETKSIKRKQKTMNSFALIIPELRRSLYPSIAEGFGCEASKMLNQTMIFNTGYQIEKQSDIVLQIIEKKIAGVALVPVIFPETPVYQIKMLQDHNIPVVFCHRRIDHISAPFVGWDWEQVGQIVGQKLIELGHRKIMYISSTYYSVARGYEKGLRRFMSLRGLELTPDMVHYEPNIRNPSDFPPEKHNYLEKIMNSKDRPTAIFCNDDATAECLYLLAVKQGMKIPEDFSLVAFGDVNRNTYFKNILSSVVIDEMQLGANAANLLCDMLSRKIPIRNNRNVLLDLGFSEGQSLGPSPA